uniref:Uncharacterized protein n=1 Tax=Florenciella parvula TaxID=236787 RepID=A0A7S2C2I3_9STRA
MAKYPTVDGAVVEEEGAPKKKKARVLPPEILSNSPLVNRTRGIDAIVTNMLATLEEPSIYTLLWASHVADNQGMKRVPRATKYFVILLVFLTASIQVFIPVTLVYINVVWLNYDDDSPTLGSFSDWWYATCPGLHQPDSAYCDEDRYWSQYDIEHEPGAKDNLCDDDWVTDADDIFPGDVVEKRFGGGNYISGDIVQMDPTAKVPVPHTVTLDGEEKHLLFTEWQNTTTKIQLDAVAMKKVILGTKNKHFKREFMGLVILEKISSFFLSVYLMSTLTPTLAECSNFLLVNRIFSSTNGEGFWLVIGCILQIISIIVVMLATQLLFLASPAIEDQLLNCAALGFLCEVDNAMAGSVAASPLSEEFNLRAQTVICHFIDTWEDSEEKEELLRCLMGLIEQEEATWQAQQAQGGARAATTQPTKKKSSGSIAAYSIGLSCFSVFYYILVCILWGTTILGSICMSKPQSAQH